ncbi:SiaB family protein kinase [Natronospora cellulosivora (SeqCode)]
MDKDIMGLRDYLNEFGIILSFTGPFSQGVIEEIGDSLKIYMQSRKNSKNNIFKVFSIFIEQTQNIRNYINSNKNKIYNEKITNSGIVIISRYYQGKYLIRSGNLVKRDDIKPLKDNLNQVFSLDQESLKNLYKKRLMTGYKDGENNANLGLIDIARKSTSIEYQFEEVDDDFFFFTLSVLV